MVSYHRLMALMVVTKHRGEVCRVPYRRGGLVGFIALRAIGVCGGAFVGWNTAPLASDNLVPHADERLMWMFFAAWVTVALTKVMVPGRMWWRREG